MSVDGFIYDRMKITFVPDGIQSAIEQAKTAVGNKDVTVPGDEITRYAENQMRKLFSFNMMTLDGFFEGPNGDIDWHNADNEEFNEFAIEQTSSLETLLFGRKTYQLMASYWPTETAINSDPIIADLMNRLSKIVFSRTLKSVDWNNTRLIRDNAHQEITNLKMQPGKDMAIFGSADLISSLMDVIDEHRVMVNPILLGEGSPLFKPTANKVRLTLANVRTFDSGNVLLTYQPV
jgi:dihydrofolate reductase